ncbi:MAG TPA: LemA family protein [Thermoanaerobaculia bacterium]|nr:LemA family protein [Thermoanaerobaculia bacterium]
MSRAMMVGCAVLAGLVVLAAVILGMTAFGTYNALITAEQAVESQWAQVENVYQRRADLVPNLVATVRGATEFERETLTAVVEARSRVGQITASPELLENPQAFARFTEAQDQLSGALSRLLVVVERYPELRSVPAFQDLMVQLEGTENRISVERRAFNETARDYNTRVRRVPAAWYISLLGWDFDPKPYFESEPGAEQAPQVDFGTPG